jgi:glycosyltransferase involved in cell wall biosynthesis
MRVVISSDYPAAANSIRGGVQSAVAYLAKGLSRIEDLDVHVLTIRHANWTGPDCIQVNGLTLHFLSRHPRFERLRMYRNFQTIYNQKLSEIQPDIVHAHDATLYAYVSLRSGFPTVITAHGIRREDGKYYASFGRRLRNYFDSLVIERDIMHSVQHLIAISRYVTDYFAGRLNPAAQVYYISNAIDDGFFTLTGAGDPATILFAGSVIPRKRVYELVQSFVPVLQKVPAAQLRIAGECHSEPAYVQSIRDLISQNNLETSVHLLGQLSETSVLQEFSTCTCLVLPSYQETTPMVLAQAMAAGKPVIATQVGGVAEMIGPNSERGLLIQRGDFSGITEAMLLLLNDADLRRRLGQSAQTFARENYHVDCVAQRTYSVYQNILSREQHPHA